MGLITPDGRTLLPPQPESSPDPISGKRIGDTDPFFTNISNELADRGFLVTTSGGFANSLGRADGEAIRDETIEH